MATSARESASPGLRRNAIGLREVTLIYLYRTTPGRVAEVGLVHLDDPA